jgi:hypothetical protein
VTALSMDLSVDSDFGANEFALTIAPIIARKLNFSTLDLTFLDPTSLPAVMPSPKSGASFQGSTAVCWKSPAHLLHITQKFVSPCAANAPKRSRQIVAEDAEEFDENFARRKLRL